MTDTSQSTDESQAIHRLRDIVVEEVSLVDRAANKRRFLVVKRSDAMADANSVDDEEDDTESEDTVVKPKKAAGESEADESADEDTAEASPEKTKPPKKKKQAKGSLDTVTEALKRLMVVAKGLQQAPDMDVATELESVASLLHKKDAAKDPVLKAGARMARGRLERFHKAIELLSTILEELTATDDAEESEAVPTAGAAEAKPVTDTADASPVISELVAEMQKLARVVKRQDEELSGLRQTRGVSNAIQVDGARRAEPQEVSWPFDMNRPISRDKVRKEVSFFDE